MKQIHTLKEALKLLNGLDNDPIKRTNIVEYVQKNGTIAVFAYASLIWKPLEHVENIIPNCILTGYKKGFWCQDSIYRGTTKNIGLTMGLKPCENNHVKGYLLTCSIDRSVSFIQALAKREIPINDDGIKMDIYTFDFLPVLHPDGKTYTFALTCVVNCHSPFCLSTTLSIENQAEIIGQAYGLSGTNFQYLDNCLKAYKRLALVDTSTQEIEQIHAAVIVYRSYLPESHRRWLDNFDLLKTKDERPLSIKCTTINNIQKQLQKLLTRLYSVKPMVTRKYQRTIL